MWIRTGLFNLMRIKIRIFAWMRIRIRISTLLVNRIRMRIREAQKHTHPADPDPEHWILECMVLRGSFLNGWLRPAVEKAKKLTQCFSCGDLNGVVKKCGLLKISHEKYR
jgi:hypothetical protein